MMMDPLISSDQGSVCQTCGDEGFINAFIYCCNCLDFPIHRYCLSVMPETANEVVIWYCEQCEAKSLQSKNIEAANLVKLNATPVKKKQKKQRNVASLIAGTEKVICQEDNTEFGGEYTDCSKWLTPLHLHKKQRTNRKRNAVLLVPKKKEDYNNQCGLKTGTQDHSGIVIGPTERCLEGVVLSKGQIDESNSFKPLSEPEKLNFGTQLTKKELDKPTCNEQHDDDDDDDTRTRDYSGIAIDATERCLEVVVLSEGQTDEPKSSKPSDEPEKLNSDTVFMVKELNKLTCNEQHDDNDDDDDDTGTRDHYGIAIGPTERCLEVVVSSEGKLDEPKSSKPSSDPEKLKSDTFFLAKELDKPTCNQQHDDDDDDTGVSDIQLMDTEKGVDESSKPSFEPEKLKSGTQFMGKELDKPTCNEQHDDDDTGVNDLQLMDAEKGVDESSKPSFEPEKLKSGTQFMGKELDKPTCNEQHDDVDDDDDDTGANGLQLMVSEKGVEECYYRCAQPLVDAIWRGSFCVAEKDYDVFEGCVAHLSDKACYKVFEEANTLQSLLHFKMQPKIDLWPKSFQGHQASDDKIALYFFPADPMCEMAYDRLVLDMVEEGLAMRATTKNAELLIFTSLDLPPIYWRFQGKYYLWGVFRGNRNGVTSQDTSIDTNKMLTRLKTSNAFSPRSPLTSNGDIGGVDMDPESGD